MTIQRRILAWSCGAIMLAVGGISANPAHAQVSFDSAGSRALGMAGAFVAVADDPTATLWNPAGLVKGPIAGLTIGADRFHFRDPKGPPIPGTGRSSSENVALGAWPVGVSFARVQTAFITKDGDGATVAAALSTSHVGFTVLQSLGDFVVIGGTLKYLRGTAAFTPVTALSADQVLEAALAAGGESRGTFDFDLGILAGTERVRAGAAFKNLLRPGFTTIGGKAIHLERRVRLGLAAFPRDGVTLAIDVDLDTADPLVGLRRTIAMGGEARLSARLALRAGIRWEQGESAWPIGAIGGSVSFRQSFWLDGYYTRGHSRSQGAGFALRAGF